MQALVGPVEGRLVRVLVRHRGDDAFSLLPYGGGLHAGDTAVIYNLDPTRDDELFAANDRFSGEYYVQVQRDPWFDEAQLIHLVLPESGADVLEVCCGAGRVSPAMVRQGNRVTAVDKSEPCIRHVARTDRSGVRYRVGDALALEDSPASYDFACCWENSLGVFFGQQARLLAELVRVTRPGGRVILGLREVAWARAGEIHVYHSGDGYLELAQTFDRAAVDRLCDQVGRITAREYRPGEERPWGGKEFFALLTIGELPNQPGV